MGIKPHIALTITSCKRPNLFESTINSLKEMLEDHEIVDTIIHYDDSSDEESREWMRHVLEDAFPEKMICYRRFEIHSFDNERRHMCIMNQWIDDLSRMNIDFVLHTEEDWRYEKKFSIADAISLMSSEVDCAQVGLSQPIRKTPEEIKIITNGKYWKWIYYKEKSLLENLFLDTVEMETSNIPGYWCYFINWPYFGLRPGIYDFKKIYSVGSFEDNGISFELDFAKRYAENYVTWCNNFRVCTHIGGDISSYEINKSKR